jgi:hypothetical protein
MQDHTFDELREALGAQQGEGFEEKFENLLHQKAEDPDWADEMKMREEYRQKLEPKYVIVKAGFGRYKFRVGYVEMHRDLLSEDEIRHRQCDGGGFWGVDGENHRVTLYDSSSDFGRPKHIEEAIRQDGFRLLEILGKVCDKSGEQHDLSGYDITYMDAIGHRHKVEPISNIIEFPTDEQEVKERLREYASSTQALVNAGHKHSYARQKSKDYAKKKKAKRRQQKQARRKN